LAKGMGASISQIAGVSETFLDIEGGQDAARKLNAILGAGSNISGQEMFQMSDEGDIAGILTTLQNAMQGSKQNFDRRSVLKAIADATGGTVDAQMVKQLRSGKAIKDILADVDVSAEAVERGVGLLDQQAKDAATTLEVLGTTAQNAASGLALIAGGAMSAYAGSHMDLSSGIVPQARPLSGQAKGGIITKPTRVLVGEAGPEMIVPFNGGSNKSYKHGLARGGSIIPLAQAQQAAAGMSGQGTLGSAADPSAQRRREAEFKAQADSYRADLRKEEDEIFRRQLKLEDRRSRDWRGIGSMFKGAVGAFEMATGTTLKHVYETMVPQAWQDSISQLKEGMQPLWDSVTKKLGDIGNIVATGMSYVNAWQNGGARGVAGQLVQSGHAQQGMDWAGGKLAAQGGKMGQVGQFMQGPGGQAGMAGLSTFAQGGSVGESLVAVGDSLAVAGMTSGNPAFMAAAGAYMVGKLVIGKLMKGKNKKTARKDVINKTRGIKDALKKGSFKHFNRPKDLMNAIGRGPGDGSWDLTVKAIADETGFGWQESEGLLAVLLGNRMTNSERDAYLQEFDSMAIGTGKMSQSSDGGRGGAVTVPQSATPISKSATGGVGTNSSGNGTTSSPGTTRPNRRAPGSSLENGGDWDKPVVVNLVVDGKKMAEVVTDHQGDQAYQI